LYILKTNGDNQVKLFVVFEGLDGSGKSTQVKILLDKLISDNYQVLPLREPGSTEIGEKILNLLDSKQELTPIMEFLLFSISRSAVVNEKIKPALETNKIVLCDRYFYSSIAYQGAGRNLDKEYIDFTNQLIIDKTIPDIVFYLDLTWEEKINRKGIDKSDRFEKENKIFHDKVRQEYLSLARNDSDRWVVIDANLELDEISKLIYSKIKKHLI
tara:strand:+ start:586 stop:1227 length:642 start_codon:yes stop_codon:yes gene_type:complete